MPRAGWDARSEIVNGRTITFPFLQWLLGEFRRSARKYAEAGPPTSATTWTVNHELNTEDVLVQVYEGGVLVSKTITIVDENSVRIDSGTTMTADGFRVVVIG